MPEFRQELISGQWVIMATGRAKRPEAFARKGEYEVDHLELPGHVAKCPFCKGNEAMTPAEVLSLAKNGVSPAGKDWQVRVVPNKFPALVPGLKKTPNLETEGALYKEMNGYGVHEVLIETPEHNRHPGVLETEQMTLVVQSYLQRFRALAENRLLHYVQLFRNHGREAGASMEHPHSQLIAMPFVPVTVRQEIESAHRHYFTYRQCPYCFLLNEELRDGKRMVAENSTFCAFLPYAARYPFETWILPRRHQSSFLEITGDEMEGFSDILTLVLGRMARALDEPPYNYFLHCAPFRTTGLPHYHWHLELVPKLITVAGFEMGSGIFINVILPEEAALYLRKKGEAINEHTRKDFLYSGLAQPPAGR